MSPLWPDRLGVALYPQRLVLARSSGGPRLRLTHKEIVELAPARPGMAPWQPAADALAAKAASGALARADVSLILSNHFVHYAVVPWSDTLGAKEEELAFARHCFDRVYGEEASAWAIKLSRAHARASRLAAAVDQTLVDSLNVHMAPVGARYRSLQPHLMASFNRWCARLGERAAWIVVAEPGLLCLALVDGAGWQSARTIKVGADWMAELPGVLAREECLADIQTECETVLVFAPDGPHAEVPRAGKWRIEPLLPAMLPGMIAGADEPFSFALGA
ncbi:MAG: hypothetical protein HYY28_10550 [Betaproteobacteria bacterium]|nr:hypothetical protein [Betaproteobacteria bacterium]MBI2960744.1 hypothetical protein [Betaproteobacteria bacterium]